MHFIYCLLTVILFPQWNKQIVLTIPQCTLIEGKLYLLLMMMMRNLRLTIKEVKLTRHFEFEGVVTYSLAVRPETEGRLIVIIDKLPLEICDPGY